MFRVFDSVEHFEKHFFVLIINMRYGLRPRFLMFTTYRARASECVNATSCFIIQRNCCLNICGLKDHPRPRSPLRFREIRNWNVSDSGDPGFNFSWIEYELRFAKCDPFTVLQFDIECRVLIVAKLYDL